jgi:hypothetical protein
MDEHSFDQYLDTAPVPAKPVSQHLPSSPDNSSVQLRLVLARLGLSDYYHRLVANGFDSWQTVRDITEKDLGQLSFKRGHRRKLQREIANQRHRHSLNGFGNNSNSNSGPTLARAGNTRDGVDRGFSIPTETSEEYQGLTQSAKRELQEHKVN